ncbi:putative ferric-chelate reductase 1 isoform X2 [Mya arenaria]|nr:putative ferric-chelate reductase 1 isoform X2 [Mya arenaria]
MKPGHGYNGQNRTVPYYLTLSKNTYYCGDEITVTLAALKGFNFTGFLCQARPDQADNATTGTLYGEYSKTTNNCDGKGSVTHSTRDLKESMVLKWKANSNYTSVTFVCTVVQDKATYWVKGLQSGVTFSGSGDCSIGEAVNPGVTIQMLMLLISSINFLM